MVGTEMDQKLFDRILREYFTEEEIKSMDSRTLLKNALLVSRGFAEGVNFILTKQEAQ